MDNVTQTLADRLTSERMPVTEALRIAMSLAGRLRELHDQGRVHGALTPSAVVLSGSAIQLAPVADAKRPVTPYTAPEVLQGRPADARSDIFSFGAIFYEMLAGSPAFSGTSKDALEQAILTAAPRPTGSPAIDRVVNECLAKSTVARFQRVHKVMLELRLLSSSARRAAPTISAASAPPPTAPTHKFIGQMQDLETRISARLAEQEKSVASFAEVAAELLKTLRELRSPAPAPTPIPAPEPRRPAVAYSSEFLEGHSAMRLENAVNVLADRLSRLDLLVSTAVERIQKLEANLDAFDTDAAALRDSVTRDIRNFERSLKAQNAAIESARTAMGQTDDLVERVVEALDSLQSMLVNPADQRSRAS